MLPFSPHSLALLQSFPFWLLVKQRKHSFFSFATFHLSSTLMNGFVALTVSYGVISFAGVTLLLNDHKGSISSFYYLPLLAFLWLHEAPGMKPFDDFRSLNLMLRLLNYPVSQGYLIEQFGNRTQSFDCRTRSNLTQLTTKFCQSNIIEPSIAERTVIELNRTFDYELLFDRTIFTRLSVTCRKRQEAISRRRGRTPGWTMHVSSFRQIS